MLLSVRILQRNKIYHHLDDKAHGGTGPLKLFEAQLTQSVCWLSSSDSSIKRNKYSNTEIRTAFENRKYCTAVFLDFFHTFHRVWLKGVLNQKSSYLYDKKFGVRCNAAPSPSKQRSLVNFYILYTAEVPKKYIYALQYPLLTTIQLSLADQGIRSKLQIN